jgi:antitoxin (DNA-binding transcriptional repressor) of toxin-antitoxin stability system
MEATVDYATTHFPQLLEAVAQGEEVIVHRDSVPVARLSPVAPGPRKRRPKLGELPARPIWWSEDCFDALDDEGLKEFGFP